MNDDLQRSLSNLATTLETKLNEKSPGGEKDRWEKAKTIASWVAAIAVPVVLGVSGYYVNLSLKGKEVQASMISLAINIPKEPPQQSADNKNIRTWAIQVIKHYSEVKMPEATQLAIIESQPLVSGPSLGPSPPEYRQLFDSAQLTEKRVGIIDYYKMSLVQGRSRYEKVAAETCVPWFIVGILHQLETGGNFNVHLHNSDPLTDRTANVPSGRPSSGTPPFTWEESATDALKYLGWDKVLNWTVEEALYRLERYNGLGYYRRGIKTPYLWAGSNHFTKGKFVADGHFDPEARSNMIGAAVLLKFAVPEEELQKLVAAQPNKCMEPTR